METRTLIEMLEKIKGPKEADPDSCENCSTCNALQEYYRIFAEIEELIESLKKTIEE